MNKELCLARVMHWNNYPVTNCQSVVFRMDTPSHRHPDLIPHSLSADCVAFRFAYTIHTYFRRQFACEHVKHDSNPVIIDIDTHTHTRYGTQTSWWTTHDEWKETGIIRMFVWMDELTNAGVPFHFYSAFSARRQILMALTRTTRQARTVINQNHGKNSMPMYNNVNWFTISVFISAFSNIIGAFMKWAKRRCQFSWQYSVHNPRSHVPFFLSFQINNKKNSKFLETEHGDIEPSKMQIRLPARLLLFNLVIRSVCNYVQHSSRNRYIRIISRAKNSRAPKAERMKKKTRPLSIWNVSGLVGRLFPSAKLIYANTTQMKILWSTQMASIKHTAKRNDVCKWMRYYRDARHKILRVVLELGKIPYRLQCKRSARGKKKNKKNVKFHHNHQSTC